MGCWFLILYELLVPQYLHFPSGPQALSSTWCTVALGVPHQDQGSPGLACSVGAPQDQALKVDDAASCAASYVGWWHAVDLCGRACP